MLKNIFVAAGLTLLFLLAINAHAEARPRHHIDANGNDPRPHAWCGWWLRQQLAVRDRSFNLAAQWRHFGQAAAGPAVGVIVVWWHHVGIITGRTPTGWVIKSGNDGHRVRERERSLRGVIAFRHPQGGAS